MSGGDKLRIYLDKATLARARAGRHNFLDKVCAAAAAGGLRPEYRAWSADDALRASARPGYSLMHMKPALPERSLSFRAAYVLPFWRIERSDQRWEWDVAKAEFPAEDIDPGAARRFADGWRNRLYSGQKDRITREGYVLVPLQGRLLDHRSFQSASPLQMIEAVLEHLPRRRVIATLHPKEVYAPEELVALDDLTARFARLEVQRGGSDALLPGCDMVVTQNSAVGFSGLFFDKPLVLFARIDFHHIAANVLTLGAETALHGAEDMAAPRDPYLWWFLQEMAINAGRPDAEGRIAERLRAGGWPI